MSRKPKKPTVYAFGFDEAGFEVASGFREEDAFVLRFVGYEEDCSLAEADGLIIPSGIFEELETFKDWHGARTTRVQTDVAQLAAREKEFINATQRGAWTVFLVRRVLNVLGYGQTDLGKKMLNSLAENVSGGTPEPAVICKADEFRGYLDRFGVAETTFSVRRQDGPTRILAQAKNRVVGFEAGGDLFFLPFFSNKTTGAEAEEAATSVTSAVLEYKSKHDISLPPWVEAITFASEKRPEGEIQQTRRTLVRLAEEARTWEGHKAILSTSGENLNAMVTSVLRGFFGLDLKSEERFIEDALIYSPSGDVRYVVEMKGVNGGIKREHINQVDSHRERLGITSTTSGLLIVNDFMDVEGFDARKAKIFDANNLTHASNTNVKILRTVTLIEWMFALELGGDRHAAFFEICDRANPLVEGPAHAANESS